MSLEKARLHSEAIENSAAGFSRPWDSPLSVAATIQLTTYADLALAIGCLPQMQRR